MSVPVLDPTTAGPPPVSSPTDPTKADPFFYGWREVQKWLPNGNPTTERVPLTEWDVLHPQEEDFIVNDDPHDILCHFLKGALLEAFLGRDDVKVLHDHRVDWQVPGIIPHGPDIAVFDGMRSQSTGGKGTVYVKDLRARPVLVIEVTSETTRKHDLGRKVREYHLANVPFYLIVDRLQNGDRAYIELIGYRNTAAGYEVIPPDTRGVWIPTIQLWFRAEGNTVRCTDRDGREFRDHVGVVVQRDEAEQRAEQEKQRAEQEKQRADDLERQLLELREQLTRRPPGP